MPEEKGNPKHGKKPNQKLKPYLVLQYLLHNSDETHAVSAPTIVNYLNEIGIDAERRSIYRDIEEINIAMLLAKGAEENDIYTLDDAKAELEDEEYGEEAKYIIYDSKQKGFYVRERRYDLDEIRLAAESIYAAKFLTEKEAETFVDLLCGFVSNYQADQIKHDVFLTDRIKTDNKNTFRNITTINSAMMKEYSGEKHIPEKITFKYLKHTISDLKQQVERRQGATYKVSPYALLLTDGNYYLLAFDDKSQKMRTYRVDRMRSVNLTNEPREGAEAFAAIDMKSYTQRVFGMFGGEKQSITIRFVNSLLDTVIDRFGTTGIHYLKTDDNHFTINAPIDVSDQFFGWLCGFGKKAKIISPPKVAEQFTEYIDNIRNIY